MRRPSSCLLVCRLGVLRLNNWLSAVPARPSGYGRGPYIFLVTIIWLGFEPPILVLEPPFLFSVIYNKGAAIATGDLLHCYIHLWVISQPLYRIAQVGSHSKSRFTLATDPWCWNSVLASGDRCHWSNSQRVLVAWDTSLIAFVIRLSYL